MFRAFRLVLAVAAPIGVLAPVAARADEPYPGVQAVCSMVDRAAGVNRLPPGFLARVLWQESRFRSAAVSPKGAIGVAQFMPPTALERGLADPRDTGPAIRAAARMLSDLDRRFGNLGLAAAAYNAGAGRVGKWLHGNARLPGETRAYVRIVTGRDVDAWTIAAPAAAAGLLPEMQRPCLETVTEIARAPILQAAAKPARRSPRALWQMQLDQRLERAFALLAAERQARAADVPEPVAAARALCDRMRALGARCVVYAR